uniref:Uncharacterized protein n=1 Tax=Timema tahoe TaxID=61484 RepID=A0A7R9FNS3_9NEOP|nr:unnamed protein product [Timema tahoe]
MMKSVFLTAVCLAVILGVVSGAPTPAEKKYTDRYDHLNVDDILQNKRTTNVYIKCVLDKGPCPPEGQELKERLPPGCRAILFDKLDHLAGSLESSVHGNPRAAPSLHT